jgi:hypothetical protein
VLDPSRTGVQPARNVLDVLVEKVVGTEAPLHGHELLVGVLRAPDG